MRPFLFLLTALSGFAANVQLPLVFEAHSGAAGTRFTARPGGLKLSFDDAGLSILAVGERDPVRIRFGGRSTPEGSEPTGGESHYLIGPDRGRWRTHVKHFRRVRYPSVYPGIDMVFYGAGRDLEFDFAVQPGADPGAIRMRVEGAGRPRVSAAGELVIGSFRFGKPTLYQPTADGRRQVRGAFRIDRGQVGFDVGVYDRSLPLIIDPILLYTTYWGGLGNDTITGLTTDSTGNIYITGYTASTSLPTTTGVYKRILNPGDTDAFVAKLNPAATSILYSTFVGGGSGDYARAIAVDSTGAAYITGATIGNFPVTSGAFRQSPVDAPAIYAAKLDATGASLSYATYLGGGGVGLGIAVDSTGSAWIAGYTTTPAFPVTLGLQPIFSGASDGFLMRLNGGGTAMTFSTFLGGRGEDQATSVTLDSSGNAYVAGYTSGQGFLVTGGAYQAAHGGGTDAFVAKVISGGSLSYSTYLGGTADERAHAVAVDASGNAYVGGQTASANFPVTAGAYQTVHAGSWDGFVTKLNAAGSAASYSTMIGGSGQCVVTDLVRSNFCDSVYGIAVDGTGSAYLAGLAGSGFPLAGAQQTVAGGAGDGFAARLSANGTRLLYSTYMGGTGGDLLASAALGAGVPVMGGLTTSTNLPVTAGALRTSNPGGYEGMLTRLGACTSTLGSSGSFFPKTSGNYSIDVFAPAGCSWAATTEAPWITLTTTAGVGNGPLQFTVAANTGLARSGTIDVGGATYTVQQVIGSCVQLGYYGSWFPASGGSYTVPVFADCAWTASSNQSWIGIVSGAGSGNGSVSYTIAANSTGVVRSGQIDVNGIKFNVNQVGGAGSLSCSYTLSRQQDLFDSFGGSSSLLVTSQAGCQWTVSNPHSWITITAGLAGNGDGVIGYTVERNLTGAPRAGEFSVAGVTVAISQGN